MCRRCLVSFLEYVGHEEIHTDSRPIDLETPQKKNATLKQFRKETGRSRIAARHSGGGFGQSCARLRTTHTRPSVEPSSCTTRALDCRRARATGIVASALVRKLLVSAFRGMAAQDYRLCRMASAGCLTVLFSVILHPANAAVVPAALGSRATGWELLDVNNGPLPLLHTVSKQQDCKNRLRPGWTQNKIYLDRC